MQANSHQIFRFLVAFISIYHFTLGIIGIFGSPGLIATVVYQVYGAQPEINAQFIYLAKFISVYMLIFALTMAILAWNPQKYRHLVWIPITLFSIRIIQRLALFGLLSQAFNTSPSQNLRVIIPITILSIALFMLRPKAEKSSKKRK